MGDYWTGIDTILYLTWPVFDHTAHTWNVLHDHTSATRFLCSRSHVSVYITLFAAENRDRSQSRQWFGSRRWYIRLFERFSRQSFVCLQHHSICIVGMVSGKHALITQGNLVDLGSTNGAQCSPSIFLLCHAFAHVAITHAHFHILKSAGTFINNKAVKPRVKNKLKSGDSISLGEAKMKVVQGSAGEISYTSPLESLKCSIQGILFSLTHTFLGITPHVPSFVPSLLVGRTIEK